MSKLQSRFQMISLITLPRIVHPIALTAVILLFLCGAVNEVSAGAPSNDDCMDCHDASEHENNLTFKRLLDSSTHSGFACIDCHTTITSLPHADTIPKVDCGSCHTDVAQTYKFHGQLAYPGGADIPRCVDCHGKHDILPSSNPLARTHKDNLPKTCGNCHENIDLVKKHELLYGSAVSVYQSSIHGQTSNGGHPAAACIDCHSTGGSAHRILAPDNTESSINHFNIPLTCGTCHGEVAKQFAQGVHGKLAARGDTRAPVCTNCHGEHGIISAKDPRSPVSPNRIAEATCTPCHQSASLNEKYAIPTGSLRTWVDSYHGLKSKEGDIAVANCASCHGAHLILPQSDPMSSINIANVQKTCGQCHPGISATLASVTVHGTPGVSASPIAGAVRTFYIFAIYIIIGLMLLYVAFDYRKQVRLVLLKDQIRRMTGNEVFQHWLLLISFVILVLTGFALRYSGAWWVQFMFGWEGGFPLRGTTHRIAASLFMFTVVWHLFYLFSARGKQFIRDIWPVRKDISDLSAMLRYHVSTSAQRPQFGRFGYVEKMEYWALVWGAVVMIVSGLFLWFDNLAVRMFPKSLLDIMTVIHFYEAILASLAILIWHLYATIFSPTAYPMNPAWLGGKLPRDMYEHEHAADTAVSNPAELPQTGGELPSDSAPPLNRDDNANE